MKEKEFYVILSSVQTIAEAQFKILKTAAENSGYNWKPISNIIVTNHIVFLQFLKHEVFWGYYDHNCKNINKKKVISVEEALDLIHVGEYEIGDWVIADCTARSGCGTWDLQPVKLMEKTDDRASGLMPEHAHFNVQPWDYELVRINKRNIIRKATSKEIAKHFDEVGFVKIDNPMSTYYNDSKKGIIKIKGSRKLGTRWELLYGEDYSIKEEHFEDITTPSKKECKEFADFVVIREYGEEHIAEYDTREDTVTFGCKSYLWKDVEGLYNHMKTLDIVNVDVMAEGKPYSINIDTIEKILNDWPGG